jgi:hypothetical protein
MPSKTASAAFIFAVLILVAAASPAAMAAPPADACSLLTQAQVSAAVGVNVGAGSHMTPTYLKMCVWSPPGGANKDLQNVTLSLESASAYQSAKAMLQAVANSSQNQHNKTPITMTAASGLGDDALYSSMGNYSKLIVKKGDVVFQLVIYSAAPFAKKQAMERALALNVLAKL